ncbi:MAG: alkaline phosphatase family protein [Actinomycetes bacterium]
MSTPTANVLLITLDQWRAECLGALGHPAVLTPNLDRLAAEGTVFTQHFAQAVPCGPSRASLHTGLYAMTHRSVLNGTPLDDRFTNLAREARAFGYDPVLFGYTDTSPDPRLLASDDPRLRSYEGVLPGYRAVLDMPERGEPWRAWLRALGYDLPDDVEAHRPVDAAPRSPAAYRAEHSEAAFLTGEVLRHLADAGDAPWFVHATYLRPHPPYCAPEPYNTLIDPADVPLPHAHPTIEAEMAVSPIVAGALAMDWVRAPEGETAIRELRATYYGMLAEVDAQVGRLLDALRARDDWDRTLVVVTSDHGDELGDHHLTQKLGFYDGSYRVPCIVRDPRPEADPGRGERIAAFTENVDLMPTVLDWLGAAIPAQCSGRSLLPLVEGREPSAWRDAVFFEWDFRDPVGRTPERLLGIPFDRSGMAVIRDAHGKYVHFAGLPPLFFDLDEDPHEMVDRAGDPAYASRILEYAQAMVTWRLEHADRTLTGLFVCPMGVVDARAAGPRH